jgi:hypothetical protein
MTQILMAHLTAAALTTQRNPRYTACSVAIRDARASTSIVCGVLWAKTWWRTNLTLNDRYSLPPDLC